MTNPSRPPPLRVCFTALNAYPLFDPRATTPVGGMETRALTLARGLAAQNGFDVQFVVQAPWWFRSQATSGITVWNSGDGFDLLRRSVAQNVDRLPRLPWIRVRRWTPALAWQLPLLGALRVVRGRGTNPLWPSPIYDRIRADVHCCFGVSAPSATAIASALAAERPSVLFLASNSDLDQRYGTDTDYVNPNGVTASVALFAIRKTTVIVAQQETQRLRLRERFERDCEVLPGAIDLGAWDAAAARSVLLPASVPQHRFVLWVGRADDFHKRPALCLELARRLPDVPFVMLLNRANAAIEREIHNRKPANVSILESIPYAQMPALLSRSAALVSTSAAEYEGAPNVFLQAAAARIPIASLEASSPMLDLVSPAYLARGDLDRMAAALAQLWGGTSEAREIGAALRGYVEQHHDLPIVARQLSDLLRRTSDGGGSRP